MDGYAPIEVVLDVRAYQNVRVRPRGGGGGTDFFQGANSAFAKHRNNLVASLRAAATALSRQPAELGYIRVKMRPEALAKSHRPTVALFPSRATPIVGIEDAGELIVQATAAQVTATAIEISNAEIEVGTIEKLDKKTGEIIEVPNPTRARIEASAVENVSLWAPADKRTFSAGQAIEWAKSRNVALRYRIDLFDIELPQDKRTARNIQHAALQDMFFQALGEAIDGGYFALLHKPGKNFVSRVYLWLMKDPQIQSISTWQGRSKRAFSDIDLNRDRHESLLNFLDHNPIVRRVSIPGAFVRATSTGPASPKGTHTFSVPLEGAKYPVVAIVDGGISPKLKPWVVRKVVAVPEAHMSQDHGTEIASLLVDGQKINGPEACPEPNGCHLVDIGMMPTEDYFSTHYGDHQDFLHALNEEVRRAKETTGARVFCFSHNVAHLTLSASYDELSMGLDQIAVENDVVFVVSAGNLPTGAYRPEWKNKHSDVLSDLAGAIDDRLTVPGDSIFSLSVGALNPPLCNLPLKSAPARYSRRGPGFKGLVKPDLAHYGGHGSSKAGSSTELHVATTDGSLIWVHGTSFSAPLVAKTLARIDQLTSSKLSREALISLCIHGAQVPEPLTPKIFQQIKRDLVGYGIPSEAQGFLAGDPSSATLVFMDILQLKKDMFFEFQWPACLSNAGSCRGLAKATLVYTPPVNEAYGAELIRVDLDVSLRQRNVKTGKFDLKSKNVFKTKSTNTHDDEEELIGGSLKWNNIKQVLFESKQGVGQSSEWQLSLKYLERAEDPFPESGVPFAIVLTITDPAKELPVHQDMRATLSSNLIRTEDIHLSTEARVRGPRS